MVRPKALLSWSTGKDSAYTLAVLRDQAEVDIVGLVSTVNGGADRVAMHGVRRELLQRQAEAVGLPVHEVNIPWPCSNEEYEAAMSAVVAAARDQGVTRMAFGDLFLADIRAYREERLRGTGLEPMFPLWGRDTAGLARDMLGAGIAAVISCVDTGQLAPAFAGRSFDHEFLRDLPATADPCGENGEFHTFTWNGPGFRWPVPVQVGQSVDRDGFLFTDLLPGAGEIVTESFELD